ncbi:MAG: UDP-N-acetylglucosamine 2-epimerase [Candidatus Aenigmarchaeota archaeon]|nr:UDP-N-acetylglucosamine 2-epimerase [Candidatus Aenigmarchaeota archaeon]
MINIVYGTRAELIKFSPLIRELKRRKADFRTIDLGQHDNESLHGFLDLPKPDIHLGKSMRGVWSSLEASPATYPLAAVLALVWGSKVFFSVSSVVGKGDLIVTHGNTMGVPPTIMAIKVRNVLGKGHRIVHFESGFRGETKASVLLDNIYRFADRNSDVLFTPFRSTERNLRSEGMSGKIVFSGDVMRDVVKQTLKIKPRIKIPSGDYVVANITRSILNKLDARHLVEALRDSPIDVVLITNPVIEKRLQKFRLDKLLMVPRIKMMKPMDYPDFLHLVAASRGVVTDSGGLEEECAVMSKPCIVTNDYLQIKELRDFGVVRLTGCNYIGILSGLKKIKDGRWKVQKIPSEGDSPTKKIADYLIQMEKFQPKE